MVLGDMAELGPDAARLHGEVGAAARAAGIDRLWCLGEESRAAAPAFGDEARWFQSRDELVAALRAALAPGVEILIKGSRCMGLEHVVSAVAQMEGEG